MSPVRRAMDQSKASSRGGHETNNNNNVCVRATNRNRQ